MGILEDSTHPKEFAKIAMHSAFRRCAELNLYGMIEAQVAVFEQELLASNMLGS